MFIILKDISYGINFPILTIVTDQKYEEIFLKYFKSNLTIGYRLYKHEDSYFLTDEENIVVGIKNKESWLVLQLYAEADPTIKNYLKGL
jgi:hypothetical protein